MARALILVLIAGCNDKIRENEAVDHEIVFRRAAGSCSMLQLPGATIAMGIGMGRTSVARDDEKRGARS